MRVAAPLVVSAATAEVADGIGLDAAWLTPAEVDRAARFVQDTDRRDFVAAHLLVRQVAAAVLGAPPESVRLTQRCERCGGPHGRPFLPAYPDLWVSLSHSRGVVAAAAGGVPVGVDIELLDGSHDGLLDSSHVLTSTERELVRRAGKDGPEAAARAFLRLWVRKETLVKLGRITLDSLPTVDVSALPVEPAGDVDQRALVDDGLHLLDWSHPTPHALAAAASTLPPRRTDLAALLTPHPTVGTISADAT
jgi:4'-phosphopantetheinyl transferase